MGTTSSTSSSMFTGASAYSQDLQNVITNAVAIANLPITALQTQQSTINTQASYLSQTLDGDFTQLQSAVQGIQTALGGSSMAAAVSDPSVVGVTLDDGAVTGNYSIQVNDIGAYSTTLTNTWTGTSSGAADTYQLSIGSQTYNISPTDNSATSVASAINSKYGSLVQATVVNVGSNSSPSYRLSLQSTNLTSDTIDLTDNGTSTAAVQSAGAPAQYEINNSGTMVSSDSRTVDIAAGITLTLQASQAQGDSPVDISVTQPITALSDALSAFVTAYNTAQTDLTAQRGQSGGPLQGAQLVNQLQQVLDGLVTYSSPSGGAVSQLLDLGVAFNSDNDLDATLTFDESKLASAERLTPGAVSDFLGSASNSLTGTGSAAGSGFLQSATNAMTYLEDPVKGLIKTTEASYQNQLNDVANQISNKQLQVNQLQSSLTSQMEAVDAMIATMQQQYTYLSNMLQAEQIDNQAYH